MKHKIQAFIDGLILYDYILFGASFVLFLLFIILAIVLRKHLKSALFCVLLSFAILLLGPTVGYIEMHKFLYKNSVKLTEYKKLEFVEALLVKGELKNESKFHFKECKITALVSKKSNNKYKDMLLKLKPFKKMSIVERDIVQGQTRAFKIIVEPFHYKKEFNLSVEASCK
jgi:hypothetical protein